MENVRLSSAGNKQGIRSFEAACHSFGAWTKAYAIENHVADLAALLDALALKKGLLVFGTIWETVHQVPRSLDSESLMRRPGGQKRRFHNRTHSKGR